MINQRYKIIKKIGEGRSNVFLCEDYENSNANFAIKILKPDVSNEEKKNFRNEFFTLRKLEHPNIIRVEEFGSVLISENESVAEGSLHISQVLAWLDKDCQHIRHRMSGRRDTLARFHPKRGGA